MDLVIYLVIFVGLLLYVPRFGRIVRAIDLEDEQRGGL